jgi:23S rRNA (adenine2503-C2)-methyltransferase
MSQAATEEKLKQSSEKEKVNLLGLSMSQLGDWVEAIGEKRFRATQIIKWIHQMGECRFDEMNNYRKIYEQSWRYWLKSSCPKL